MTDDIFESSVAATNIFRQIGVMISDLQIYTEEHPRYQDSVAKLESALEDYFSTMDRSSQLTFTIRGNIPSFRHLPLVDTGSQGDRLVKILQNGDTAGIQLQRGITREDITQLARYLLHRSRAEKNVKISEEAAIAWVEECEKQLPKFRLISSQAVTRMKRTTARSAAADKLEELLLLSEAFVSESSIRSMFDSFRSILSSIEHGEDFDLSSITQATEEAIALMANSDSPVDDMSSGSYFDDFTFHHSINVCLMTTKIASRFISDESRLRTISMAALLHDVGKSRVPREILQKPGRLNDAEMEQMRLHPVTGAEILMQVPQIDPLCVSVAFSHHISEGPNSYPRTKCPMKLDGVTQIISVVDIFEALTAVRPYKSGLSSEKAFRIMSSMPGLADRQHLVKLLYESVGPYPVGTFVELSTGERAVVIQHNQDEPQRPKLQVLLDPEGQQVAEDTEINLGGAEPRYSTTMITGSLVRRSSEEALTDFELDSQFLDDFDASFQDDSCLMAREG